MTASKFATKSTVANDAAAPKAKRVKPTAEQVHAAQLNGYASPVRDPSSPYFTDESESMSDWFARMGVKIPTSRRVLISMVVGCLVSFTTSYFLTTVAVWLATAAMVFSGSAFLSILVLVIGAVIAIAVATRAGMVAGRFVLGFDYDDAKHTVASTVTAAKDTGKAVAASAAARVSLVRGWFSRKDDATVDGYRTTHTA